MGYRGEILVKHGVVFNSVEEDSEELAPMVYEVGDRIAQLMILPYPKIEFEEVEELSKTDRNEGGFGSTGN